MMRAASHGKPAEMVSVSVSKDFYAWSLWERLQFVVLADRGHVCIRAQGLQFAIGLGLFMGGT